MYLLILGTNFDIFIVLCLLFIIFTGLVVGTIYLFTQIKRFLIFFSSIIVTVIYKLRIK
jgi:hypothetical protein